MTIDELIEESHLTAKAAGWWEEDRNVGELLALIHSEISEALEEYREGFPLAEFRSMRVVAGHGRDVTKPMGFPIELADILIRVADLCGRHNINLEAALRLKMAYNTTRPYRHGGKKA